MNHFDQFVQLFLTILRPKFLTLLTNFFTNLRPKLLKFHQNNISISASTIPFNSDLAAVKFFLFFVYICIYKKIFFVYKYITSRNVS